MRGKNFLLDRQRKRELDERIERIELGLRNAIAVALSDDAKKLPPHILQKANDRIQGVVRKNPALDGNLYRGLKAKLEYCDLRELQDTITGKSLWEQFSSSFSTIGVLATKFGQLADLRNAIRHSRNVDEITTKEGEAAILWFEGILWKVLPDTRADEALAVADADEPERTGLTQHRCPIPGCNKVFQGSRGGWDGHVGAPRLHPDWHLEVKDPEGRKHLFKEDFGEWFGDEPVDRSMLDLPSFVCPIPGCNKVFHGSRGGWDGHVGSHRIHPDWHPEVEDSEERKRLFKEEHGQWFGGDLVPRSMLDLPSFVCPIPGCTKVFHGSRGGWDGHVGSPRMHPDWYSEVGDSEERKRLFKEEYAEWFR